MPHYLWIEFRKIFWGHGPWRALLLEGAVEFFDGRFIFPRALTDLSDKIGLVCPRQLVAHAAPLRIDLDRYVAGKRLGMVWFKLGSCEPLMSHKNQLWIPCRTDHAENTGKETLWNFLNSQVSKKEGQQLRQQFIVGNNNNNNNKRECFFSEEGRRKESSKRGVVRLVSFSFLTLQETQMAKSTGKTNKSGK